MWTKMPFKVQICTWGVEKFLKKGELNSRGPSAVWVAISTSKGIAFQKLRQPPTFSPSACRHFNIFRAADATAMLLTSESCSFKKSGWPGGIGVFHFAEAKHPASPSAQSLHYSARPHGELPTSPQLTSFRIVRNLSHGAFTCDDV